MRSQKQQQGVALITAILIVAIATILAAKLTWDNQVNIRRTEATLLQEQARFFAIGAEAAVIGILLDDDNDFDHRGEQLWPLGEQGLTNVIGIEELVLGQMEAKISEAQGKLNINNLQPLPSGNPDSQGQPTQPDPVAKEMFENLFDNLGLDRGLVDNIIDWIDTDTVPQGRGVEDGSYTAKDPGYRAANDYITSISELRSVEGITPEIYAQLAPHITAFRPDWCGAIGGPTPVNVNFASAEVLAAIPEGGATSQAQSWIEEIGDTGWENIAQLPEELTDRGDYISIKSDCVHLYVTVNIGDSLLTMYSLLDRTSGNDEIVARVRAYGLD